MSAASLGPADAAALQECIAGGGVAVIPTDTVYGLACDPCSAEAIERMYGLKGRPALKPSAVMIFSLQQAQATLPEVPERTAAAMRELLPGPVTLLLANPRRRFPLACEPAAERSRGEAGQRGNEADRRGNEAGQRGNEAGRPRGEAAPLGLRVPAWPAPLQALRRVGLPAIQSSANLSGDPDPRELSQVPESIRRRADLVLDGGALPGLASTVLDLCDFELEGSWSIVRQGALSRSAIAEALAGVAGERAG